MAQQSDWGAAEPIRQVGVRAYNAARSVLSRVPSSSRKAAPRDTSWHDQQVREANESRRQRDAREKAEARSKATARTAAARTTAKRKPATRTASRTASRTTTRPATRRSSR